MRTATVFAFVLLLSSPAFAGFGSSSVAIKAAVQSGSVDAIVAELEKAEELPSQGAIAVVMPLVDHDSYRVRDAVDDSNLMRLDLHPRIRKGRELVELMCEQQASRGEPEVR